MHTTAEDIRIEGLYYRLVALWAVAEGAAGGIMHALKLPFTGMIVGGMAVFCIIQIGYHCKGHWMIWKATLLVCIFKLLLSPHSPPTAYIAVGIQGMLGQLFFAGGFSTVGAMALGAIALVESSIQRILVAVLIYGTDFWKAVNEFLKKTFQSGSSVNYLWLLAGGYILLHFMAGLLIGNYSAKLARKALHWKSQYPEYLIDTTGADDWNHERKKGFRLKAGLWIAGLLLAFFYLQSQLDPAHSILPQGKVMAIIIRALLIIFIWLLIVAPLINKGIKSLLLSRAKSRQEEIAAIGELIPGVRKIFIRSVQLSSQQQGWKRVGLFFRILLINIL